MKDPFPEEMHRRQIDMVSDYYFAPTLLSKKNLVLERQPLDRITITGNTGIDVLIAMQKKLANDLRSNEIARMFYHNYKIWNNCKKVILITCHRRESFGDRFESICIGLKEIAKKNPLTDLVFPIHLNPSIKEAAHRLLQDIPNMHLLPPLDYQSFLWLMNRAHFILTDSGGIQEEAPYLGKPVLVMRNTTERVEAIEAGVSKLVGTDSHSIATEAQKLLDDDETYQTMAKIRHLFGDGQASKRIVQVLSDIGS
jgi:UDP-N-acetylglucosamine 2-epimerase (non-hydrolysing)